MIPFNFRMEILAIGAVLCAMGSKGLNQYLAFDGLPHAVSDVGVEELEAPEVLGRHGHVVVNITRHLPTQTHNYS